MIEDNDKFYVVYQTCNSEMEVLLNLVSFEVALDFVNNYGEGKEDLNIMEHIL